MDPVEFVGPIVVISVAVPLLITAAIIVVVIWSIRRSLPPREDPAIAELKARLARGEIDPVEYQVRMRALRDGDE